MTRTTITMSSTRTTSLRLAILPLMLSLLSGCPGYLDQLAWSEDAGRPPSVEEPPAPPLYMTGPGGDGGTPPPVTPDAGNPTPPPPPRPDAAPPVDTRPTPPPDAAPAPAGPPPCATATEISEKILVPKCGTCHGKASPAAGLDLVTAGSKARMVGVAARTCGARILITAGPPVGGVFFDKLYGAVDGCGGQMPFGAPPLNAAEIECLKRWITP